MLALCREARSTRSLPARIYGPRLCALRTDEINAVLPEVHCPGVHRIAAAVMVGVFVGHIAYAAVHIARNWSSFKIFGPYSLMPNWQDAADIAAMMKWFFGRGPRPSFDHWNYQQKVDYWAPFWGITMLVALT